MDYIGVDYEDNLYLLFNNTSEDEATFVLGRLRQRSFEAEIVYN